VIALNDTFSSFLIRDLFATISLYRSVDIRQFVLPVSIKAGTLMFPNSSSVMSKLYFLSTGKILLVDLLIKSGDPRPPGLGLIARFPGAYAHLPQHGNPAVLEGFGIPPAGMGARFGIDFPVYTD